MTVDVPPHRFDASCPVCRDPHAVVDELRREVERLGAIIAGIDMRTTAGYARVRNWCDHCQDNGEFTPANGGVYWVAYTSGKQMMTLCDECVITTNAELV